MTQQNDPSSHAPKMIPHCICDTRPVPGAIFQDGEIKYCPMCSAFVSDHMAALAVVSAILENDSSVIPEEIGVLSVVGTESIVASQGNGLWKELTNSQLQAQARK
jgi:hypothetical protein